MTNWTEGYVSDIPYALGFYRETVPAHIAFAALSVGKHPGLSREPKKILELGIGMGLGFVINAAANPLSHFEGVDFNPVHIAHARGLVDLAHLSNVLLREASFQDLAREADEGQHDLDLIILHGILTWVSSEAHSAIVEIARKRLKPGGILYVSYNCMPGWAPVLPMQRLMRENAKRLAGRSDVKTGAGLDLVQALAKEGANYFAANPSVNQRVDRLLLMDKNYLAHEYLNANWFIFHFADVAEMFGKSKLEFVASATLAENMDGISVPEGTRARLAGEADPIFKETLRDFASNKQFRRDLYGRGITTTTALEQNALLAQTRFMLAIPRSKVSFKISSPVGELNANEELYGAVADRLMLGSATLGEIVALPAFQKGGGIGAALQAVSVFVHSGQILPLPYLEEVDVAPAQRLNKVLAGKVRQGRQYNFIAAPVAGSGIQVSNIDLLLLNSVCDGCEISAVPLARALEATMRELGMNWTSEGKEIIDPAKSMERAAIEVQAFINEKVPLLRQLGSLG